MKRLILLSSICFLSAASIFAQSIPSIINLRLYNNSNFSCVIDGANYNSNSSSQRIENLQAGPHSINVYTMQWMYGGGYRQQSIYNGTIYINPATESFMTVYGGSIATDNVVAIQAPVYVNPWNTTTLDPNSRQYYIRTHPGRCGTPPPPPVCDVPRAMSDGDFNIFLNNLRNAAFESTQLSIAKTVLRNNFLTTRQVKSVLHEFSFESTKLDFAKAAYDKTLDKNNYYTINDEFWFSSSTIELNNFLASR